jgi:hypothetical protein
MVLSRILAQAGGHQLDMTGFRCGNPDFSTICQDADEFNAGRLSGLLDS